MKISLFDITINLFGEKKSNLFMISNAKTKKVYVRIELNEKWFFFY